jgi:3-oxoacyl-[acyl-carrier protein] reductase
MHVSEQPLLSCDEEGAMSSNSQFAIVTGASRGIGAAVAERLAADGYSVVINFAGDTRSAESVARNIESRGGRAQLAKADVSDPRAVQTMFDTVERTWGKLDVVVNNAGIMTLSPLVETTDESFDRQIAINLKGSFNVLREAARRLREGGRIVNFSSTTVGLELPTYSVYAATKAAIEAMTHIVAKELGQRKIRVNAVAPGPTATDLFFKGKSKEQVERLTQMIPFRRLGEPKDIADAVAFLVGPDGAWVNGQVLRVNGGIM